MGSDHEDVGATSSMVTKFSVQITYNLSSLSTTTQGATYEDGGINGRGHCLENCIRESSNLHQTAIQTINKPLQF